MADVLNHQKGPPPARIRIRGRVEAMEVALKPLKSPPLARFWTRGRWKKVGGVIVGLYCHSVLVVRLVSSVGLGG